MRRLGVCISSRKVTFFLFCLANVTISFNFAALAAAVPLMSKGLQQSENVVSQISAYYMIPYGIGALIYAPLARMISVKWILAVAMAVYGILSFVCALNSSITIILGTRVVMGLAAACVIPLCLISVGSIFEKDVRGRMVGLFFSTSFIASVAGIAVSGLCDWRWLFIVPGILGIVTAIFMVYGAQAILKVGQLPPVDYLRVWRQKSVRNILLFIFVLSFLYHGIHKWLAVYLHRQYGLEQWAISALFILIALTGAVGQNVGGYITDHLGRRVACYWGVMILAAATVLLFGKYSLFILAGILAVFSMGWALGHNGISTVLTDFPDENRSEIAGLNSAIRFFSGGLGFFVGGPFVERNIALTFCGFGIVMFLSSFFVKKIIPKS
ncbi:MAG: MFS transporter [Candidatus Omnitrophica bacterium]|nr:MFS transporter [Candidatus Omnitrophota bacterium]